MIRFAVSDAPLDTPALRASLHNPDHGGFCAFEGWVRNTNEGRAVGGLEYEIFAELAQSEGERILAEAQARFGAIDAVGIHRSGLLPIGALAVWVGVSSAHRDEAFRACRYIIDEIKHRLPVWKKEHYLEGDTAWVACAHPAGGDSDHHRHGDGHHHHHHHSAPMAFEPDYARQMQLREVGAAGQARLAAAKVLVIGAGGLGSPVLAYLAGAGVGTLGIVDDDRVEASNLHRQTLYGVSAIGGSKAVEAGRRVAAVNPVVEVELFERRLDAGDAAAVFARFDLVVECSDDMRSRFLSSDASVVSGTPVILASVHQYEGQLQVVNPRAGGPCLRCLWPEEPAPGVAGSCAQSGVLGPVPGVLGAMQAGEALKMLLGLPRASDASLLLVDLLDTATRRLAIDLETGCVARGGCDAVARRELDAARRAQDVSVAFGTLAAARAAGFQLVDLREAAEKSAGEALTAARSLPASAFEDWRDAMPRDGRILLVCASGRRSHHVARQLRAQGLSGVFSLAGGLQAVSG